jgi:hypothetical protein
MRPTIYVAGPINGATDAEANDWRSAVKESAGSWADVLDPMRRDYRGREDESVKEIVLGDKADIERSDYVIAYCPKPSVGTSMEVLLCWDQCIPCFVVVPDGVPVSPWLRFHATDVVPTVADALLRIRALV